MPPRARPTLRFLLPALLVLLAGAGAAWHLLPRLAPPRPAAHRVFLRVTGGADLGEPLHQGLECLFQDAVESLADLPALGWQAGEPANPPHSLYVDVKARRTGQDLVLTLAWGASAQGPWTLADLRAAPPAEALAQAVEALPLTVKVPRDGKLLPLAPAPAWELIESLALVDVRSTSDRAETLARSAVEAAPDCAEAHLALGIHLYSQLQWNPRDRLGDEHRAMAAFERAKALVPGHPRASRELAILLADTGRNQESLEGLAQALERRQGIPRVFEALAYAARVSGLLTVSRRALDTQHLLALGQTRQVGETTLLYQGHLPAFLETCRPKGGPIDAKGHYYKGYVALFQGRREEALRSFQASMAVPEGWYGFETLAKVHAQALEGHAEPARQTLAALCEARQGLRIADGEFTFKQGEAWAFLGDADRALDQLNRALSQGFCCLRWYEASPFLDSVRTHPRWASLLQHARERHRLREAQFPPRRFGL